MDTRNRLVDATRELLWERGYAATSPKDILSRANAGQGSMYHHFSGKMDLLTAVLVEQWAIRARDLLALLDAEQPAAERLTAFLADYLRRLQEDRPFRDLIVVSTLVAPRAMPLESGLRAKHEGLRPWTERIDRALEECEDILRASRDASRFMIMTVIHGAALIAAVSPAELPGSEESRTIAESVVDGLLRPR